ncbi:hypothetical protein [Treponema brennaborense]|uniref:Uncharacterized protein n=1 Tax=Treponema brennaborense (strain DSM 12168 / CIP 105900 / DD5/3) TaxID=906968 RepID=F4LMR2_TREBD|nr:hypothetical protein [Treponema brennaborense]AEE17802.1 hypothetical protein Trebr_2394 [Treponema brennaborense DSM 12168]
MPKTTSTLRVQARFSKPTETQLRRRYAVPKDERLQCEIRFAGQRGSAFLLTEQAIYWTTESKYTEKSSIERIKTTLPAHVSIREVTRIRAETEPFTDRNEPNASAQPAGEAAQASKETMQSAQTAAGKPARRIRIDTADRIITISADFLPEKDTEVLAEILWKHSTQDAAFAEAVSTYKTNEPIEYARTAADGFRCGWQSIERTAKRVHLKTVTFLRGTQEEARTAAAAGKKQATSFFISVGHGLRHIFDLFADLVFIAAVIVVGKQELIINWFSKKQFHFPDIQLDPLFRLDKKPAFVFCILTAGFIILKLIILFSCHRKSNAISILLLILTLLSCLLIQTHFWLFILFSVLLYICFQLSCGFSSVVIKLKMLLLILLAISLYATANIVLNDNMKDAVKILMTELKFPAVPKVQGYEAGF